MSLFVPNKSFFKKTVIGTQILDMHNDNWRLQEMIVKPGVPMPKFNSPAAVVLMYDDGTSTLELGREEIKKCLQ